MRKHNRVTDYAFWFAVAALVLVPLLAAVARAQETDGMEELCMTCWRQPPDTNIVTPYGTWRMQSDPEPPVYDLDMGGRRQRERIRDERREEGKIP